MNPVTGLRKPIYSFYDDDKLLEIKITQDSPHYTGAAIVIEHSTDRSSMYMHAK